MFGLKRFLSLAMLLTGMLLSFCSCGKVPDGPGSQEGTEKPDKPDTPDTPETGVVFNMTGEYDGSQVPDVLVFNHNGEGIYYVINVESNVEKWTVEGGAPWCHINAYSGKSGMINIIVDQYDDPNPPSGYPRCCQLTRKVPGLPDRQLTIGQESSYTRIYSAPNMQREYTLPSSGAPVDITVITNLVDWTVKNDTEWIITEKLNRYTLRVHAVPSVTSGPREGKITLLSIANGQAPSRDTPWDITLKEGAPDVAGDDYSYNEGLGWDN